MLFLSWNKSKEDRKTKKETKTRNQNKSNKKDKKEKRNKRRTGERQRKRNWKRRRPKKAKEKQRETLKNKQKMPFCRGKTFFFQTQTKNKTNKNTKEGLGPSEVARKNTRIPKIVFQLSVIFSFFCGCPKFPFWRLGQKSAHPKNTIKIGFSARHFWKRDMCHETAVFGQKNPNPEIPVIIFCLFPSLSTTETQKSAETPISIVP